ncbi:MAG: M56 family metallopeptidase [Clostridium sp.]|uniref:M56 family metallopeptidase n=1 Tax=Clostridium sp. TaxID=1506 RepID=UPI003D6CDF68
MLTELFYKILILSLSGTIIFFILTILKPITKKVITPCWNYYLIIITVITFIIPYGALIPKGEKSLIDIPTFIEEKSSIETNKDTEVMKKNYTYTNDKSKETLQINPVKAQDIGKTSRVKEKMIKVLSYIKDNLWVIWILGVIILSCSQLAGVILFKKKLKCSSKNVERQEIRDLFYECCHKLSINRKITLKVCEEIGTPMATGLFTPVITIPTGEFDSNILKMIFCHELMHHKRKDLYIKGVSFVALALHWFNPVIYMVHKELNKNCELSCDFQVIKDMNSDEKKYYGLAILNVIDKSLNKRMTLSNAMAASSKNQLKERLEMIKNGKSPKRLVNTIALGVAVVVIVTGAFVGSALGKTKDNKNSKDFAVMVKDKSLWAVNLLKSDKEVIVDKGGVFKNPSISPDGVSVAYTKDGSLYIAEIDLIKGQKKAIKVADKVVSYAWGNNTDLVYGAEKGGLNGFNLKTKKSSVYIKSEERYEEMVSDKNGTIYAEVYRYYTKDDGQYSEAKGLIKYDVALGKESLIIKSRPWNDETGDMGLVPRVAGVSKDGAYVYIWCRVHSGSTNTDGVPFGVYDVKNNKFTPFNNEQVYALAYKDNLAINPIDGKMAVVNNGGVREMNLNKTIGTVDIIKGTFSPILPESMISTTNDPYNMIAKGVVTMTPSFSPDGKKVIYSASNANEDVQQWLKAPHNIYTVDVKTKKVEKITKGNNFDFAPKYISKGQGIIFARDTGENVISLFRLKGNKEECVAKDIKLDWKLEGSLDIYIN